jgi:hypothetical protein
MRNYWVRLLCKVIFLLLIVVALLYFLEKQFPGRIEWTKLLGLVNSVISTWGNLLIVLAILAYIGYWRDKAASKINAQLAELQKHGIEIKQAVLVSIQKTNHLIDTVGVAVKEVQQFIESGEWKERTKVAWVYVEDQLQLLAKDIDKLRDRIKQETTIAIPAALAEEINRQATQDALELPQVMALIENSPTLDAEKRAQLTRILQLIDSHVEEVLKNFQATLNSQLSAILGFSANSPQLREMQNMLPLDRVYARAKGWLLLAMIRRHSSGESFMECLQQLNVPTMILNAGKKYLTHAGLSWMETLLANKVPALSQQARTALPPGKEAAKQ